MGVQYDKEHKISFADVKQTSQINQYLAFQGTGHGVIAGQSGTSSTLRRRAKD